MVSVADASAIVLSNPFRPGVVTVNISDAINLVLAEDIRADRDLPPVDRVTMDGIAISFDAWSSGTRDFSIKGIQPAGVPKMKLSDSSDCIEVMTGTELPQKADTVVPYEDIKIKNGIANVIGSITQGQNIHRQGSDALKDEHLLSPGLILSAAEIALLASVGKNNVRILSFPSTAIVSSGDELVSVETIPAAHQVRRSNAIAIQAAMRLMGWPGTIFHLPDHQEQMSMMLREIASQFDVIILSGGVSKGKFDFVPAVMEEIGVAKIFHRVNQRPGKPFWFGASSRGHIVFALPGNPVATYLCFYRYIKPWILKSMGVTIVQATAVLAKDFRAPQGLTYFLQVNVVNEHGKLMAYPDPGGGSGDFANLKKVSGFLELPEDRSLFLKDEVLPYFSFRTDK